MSRPFENINVPASREMKAALKQVARGEGRSAAAHVRVLIKTDLERRGFEVPDHVYDPGGVPA